MDTSFAFCCTTSRLSGGLDIKAGGIMAGMHRDKCGAAAVAGVMAALAITQASFPHFLLYLPCACSFVADCVTRHVSETHLFCSPQA